MNMPNIKVYLGISFALIILLIVILIIPFGKKKAPEPATPTAFPMPTTFETQPNNLVKITPGRVTPTEKVFSGIVEVTLPQAMIDLSNQKRTLRQKTPLNLSTFNIGFDYSEDKFIVTLLEPKDQSQKEFESWRTTNYPLLDTKQFLLK